MPRRIAIALALLLFPQLMPVARAQDATAPPTMRVAKVSPFLDGKHAFHLEAQITNPTEVALDDLRLRVTFFARVTSRSQLRDTVDDRASRAAVGGLVKTVPNSVDPGEQARVVLDKPFAELPYLHRNGVFPVEIALEHATGTESVRTAIPVFVSAPRAPINVTWTLPVAAPIVTPADNVYPIDAVEQLGLDRLLQQMKALARRSAAGVTLAPSPALLDTLSALAGGFAVRGPTGPVVLSEGSDEAKQARAVLDAMRAAVGAGEVVASPYAPVDLTALAAHGLGDDLVRQVTLGRATIESRLGATPAEGVLSGASVDPSSARALANIGVTRFVLPATSLVTPPSEPFNPQLFGPSRPIALRVGTADARALLIDQDMSARLDASSEGVLLAQTLIAETASAWFELPSFAPERVLTIGSAAMPSPVVLRAALDGFRSSPWMRLRTASDVLRSLGPRADATDLIAPLTRDRANFIAARGARSQLRTLSAITVERLEEEPLLDRFVLLAESREWDARPDDGVALARAASARVRAIVRNISVAKSSPVTMTSKRDEVPITIANANPFPVRVRVRLESPKLTFPNGSALTREIVPPHQRLDVTVEARAAGSFPLDVVVQSPDGRRVLARGRLTVRSTAISAVALIVVAGSLALLLFSWARKSTRRKVAAAR